MVCEFLFHPDEMAKTDFDPADAVEFWDIVNRQDWAICESVQRGMTSRVFETGYYAPMESWSLDIRRYVERSELGLRLADRVSASMNMHTDYDYIVLGLGGFGQRRRLLAVAPGRARRAWASSSSSWGTSGARSQDHRRIIRLSLPHSAATSAGQAGLPRRGTRWSATAGEQLRPPAPEGSTSARGRAPSRSTPTWTA